MRMRLLLGLIAASLSAEAGAGEKLRILPERIVLQGARASQQLVALLVSADGSEREVTSETSWQLQQPNLVRWLAPARLGAAASGSTMLTATWRGQKAQVPVTIRLGGEGANPTFSREILRILTKRGCNTSACHGGVKGRGGFKLSASGLYPEEDYEWILQGGGYQVLTPEVKGERIPRVDLANPERSLLLTKPTLTVAHGGGKRLEPDSEDYRTMLAWVRAGAPFGDASRPAPAVMKLTFTPPLVVLPEGGERQLLVTAHFDNGQQEDFTHQVIYSPNDPDIVSVSPDGRIRAQSRGETAIVVRAAGWVGSVIAGVTGPRLPRYPHTPRANFIDQHVFSKLERFQILPSELSSDSEFLRRVCLDLTGALPPPERVREFLSSRDPNKREKLIDALIGSPEFVDYWTWRFADVFRVAIFTNGLSSKWSQSYWEWIRDWVEKDLPYDQVARERIASQGYEPASRHFLPYNQIGPPADVMAEEVRVFLGRRLDCAQCHNHPYENWSQDQFWGMAAFFSRLFRVGAVVFDHPTNMDLSTKDVGGSLELLHPRTKQPVKPVVFDRTPLAVTADGNPRRVLAEWMTRHPYFAEAAVNRIWGYFFGRGIVDPVDDFRSTNPPTHPELLAALAKDFADHGYRLRHLMRTIVRSRTYQLSYRPNETNRRDVWNYSRALARALDAEVLLDAVVDVTGIPETFATAVSEGASVGEAPRGTRAVQLRDPDTFYSRFLELYGRASRGAVPERNAKPNLSQALHILAGSTYVDRLQAPGSRLESLLRAGASDEKIVEEFYLAALARYPEPEERREVLELIAKRGNRQAALGEFVWALLSSREFAENH
ncbi:MAG: DUF1549 and DUF1553 domain-containing protein [Bryobacteraceae bacterium]|nr:DUF1549 and DUF1553 domain-containing protein [Bryobacteraceae bacterium]MDW8377708.1 DUF1549 and DUF1553 domain-containing protein [Bryobacterales bacterium]